MDSIEMDYLKTKKALLTNMKNFINNKIDQTIQLLSHEEIFFRLIQDTIKNFDSVFFKDETKSEGYFYFDGLIKFYNLECKILKDMEMKTDIENISNLPFDEMICWVKKDFIQNVKTFKEKVIDLKGYVCLETTLNFYNFHDKKIKTLKILFDSINFY